MTHAVPTIESTAVLEPTEILQRRDAKATPADREVPSAYRVDQHDYHLHLHLSAEHAAESFGSAQASMTARAREQQRHNQRNARLAGVAGFGLATVVALVLAVPVAGTALIALPAVAAVANGFCAIKIATAKPGNSKTAPAQ